MIVINSFESLSLEIMAKGNRKKIFIVTLFQDKEKICRLEFLNLTDKQVNKMKDEMIEIVDINTNPHIMFKFHLQDIVEILQKYF